MGDEMIMGDPHLALDLARLRGEELRASAQRDRLARRARGPGRDGWAELGEGCPRTGWAWLGRLTGARTAAR